jgi:hypothetical protein
MNWLCKAALAQKVKALENRAAIDLFERFILVESTQSETLPHDPQASCLVRVLQDPLFTPPSLYDPIGKVCLSIDQHNCDDGHDKVHPFRANS